MGIDKSKLMSEFEDEISGIVDGLSMSLPLSGAQLKAAFTSEELKELDELMGAVHAAKLENEKVSVLLEHSSIVLKLLSVLGIVIGL